MITDVREVSGGDGTLAESIAGGDVPMPAVMDFNAWQQWRKGPGRRPQTTKGDPATTTPRQESELWRGTMQRLFGAEEWRTRLEEAQLAAPEAAETAPTGAAGSGASAAAAVEPEPATPATTAAVGSTPA